MCERNILDKSFWVTEGRSEVIPHDGKSNYKMKTKALVWTCITLGHFCCQLHSNVTPLGLTFTLSKISFLQHMGGRKCGSGGIRTHASWETGALNQRLRPLGHTTMKMLHIKAYFNWVIFIWNVAAANLPPLIFRTIMPCILKKTNIKLTAFSEEY